MNYGMLSAIGQLQDNIAALDFSGAIVEVNNGWKLFGAENGLVSPNHCIGQDDMAACRHADGSEALTHELDELIAGRRPMMMRSYPCHHPDQLKRWFVLLGARDDAGQRIVLSHIDVTVVLDAELMAQLENGELAARLRSQGI